MNVNDAPKHEAGRGSLRSYIVGFALSLALTLTAYVLVVGHVFSGRALLAAILVLAIMQFTVQLVCFLHLGRESHPRWNLTVFGFMLVVLIILVFGTLWIMKNLNYHTDMTPAQTDQSIIKDEGAHQ